MSDAERRLITSRLLVLISLGIVLYFANELVKAKRAMEADEVISDVELFLKANRLQELILPLHKEIIKRLEEGWSNASYRDIRKGDLNAIKVSEWIRQNSIDGLSP